MTKKMMNWSWNENPSAWTTCFEEELAWAQTSWTHEKGWGEDLDWMLNGRRDPGHTHCDAHTRREMDDVLHEQHGADEHSDAAACEDEHVGEHADVHEDADADADADVDVDEVVAEAEHNMEPTYFQQRILDRKHNNCCCG
jgi:hypothetical protein